MNNLEDVKIINEVPSTKLSIKKTKLVIYFLLLFFLFGCAYFGYEYIYKKRIYITNTGRIFIKNDDYLAKEKEINDFKQKVEIENQNVYKLQNEEDAKNIPYPSYLVKFINDFNTKAYKIGVEKIYQRNISGTLDEGWEDSWGDFFYINKGDIVRYDKDVAKYDYTETIDIKPSTLYVIYALNNDKYYLYPNTKKIIKFTVDKNINDSLDLLFTVMNILESGGEIYTTAKKNYFTFSDTSMASNYVFYINPKTSKIENIYIQGANNSSYNYIFHYSDITNSINDYLQIPSDYSQ